MNFEEALTELLGFVGERVSVSVSAADGEPVLILDAVGILERGTELGEIDDPAEAYLFSLDQHASFVLDKASFRGARWDGPVLVIEMGPILLRIATEI